MLKRPKILLVFALTGTTAVFLKRLVFVWLGIDASWPLWQRIVLWVVIVLPLYQVLLLAFGTLFGEFAFFWSFIKRMFGLGRLRRPVTPEDAAERHPLT